MHPTIPTHWSQRLGKHLPRPCHAHATPVLLHLPHSCHAHATPLLPHLPHLCHAHSALLINECPNFAVQEWCFGPEAPSPGFSPNTNLHSPRVSNVYERVE
ncbi:hypothetical protein M405DRAFT_399659 [Rhizopogon salebrosus TDB-379]|nr:hypothetical protein M405DRAFT_399659 [Rhizopogon salebrosus TDB-379]